MSKDVKIGEVQYFDFKKGFGFAQVEGYEKDLFFHVNGRRERFWHHTGICYQALSEDEDGQTDVVPGSKIVILAINEQGPKGPGISAWAPDWEEVKVEIQAVVETERRRKKSALDESSRSFVEQSMQVDSVVFVGSAADCEKIRVRKQKEGKEARIIPVGILG